MIIHFHHHLPLFYLCETAAGIPQDVEHCFACRLARTDVPRDDVDDYLIAVNRKDSSAPCAAWEEDAVAPSYRSDSTICHTAANHMLDSNVVDAVVGDRQRLS